MTLNEKILYPNYQHLGNIIFKLEELWFIFHNYLIYLKLNYTLLFYKIITFKRMLI